MSATSSSSLHVYAREISATEKTSLNLLAAHIAPHSTVLDLGCGTGALGRWLAPRVGCTIDGVTLSEAEAEQARTSYRKVIVGDLEQLPLIRHFAPGTYDFIVCADVLEHLADPASLLEACRPLLTAQGKLLVSVPNAAYCGLIAELMQGNFEYRDEGLLDRTHLRFFTRKTLAEFLASNRWSIDSLETVQRDLPDSEFKLPFDTLPPTVSRYLLAAPDALSYQFILSAHPGEPIAAKSSTETLVPPEPSRFHGNAWFSAELFLQTASGYNQAHKLNSRGVIGQSHQTLRFKLQPTSEPITRLRFDPADRPGFLHLHALRLISNDGETLWNWQPFLHGTAETTNLEAVPSHQIQWHLPGFPSASPLLVLLGDDPWIELPISPAMLEKAFRVGATLEVDLGWPLSADYLMAAHEFHVLNEQVKASQQAMEHKSNEVSALLHRLDQSTQDRLSLDEKVTSLLAERTRLTTAQQALLHSHARIQQELDGLSTHLQWIENSTVFRLTRPLVHFKMAVQSILAKVGTGPHPDAQATLRPLKPTLHPVDVIVPVYKGLDDTRRCILSVLHCKCISAIRLIVINDASPEPEVTEWLREVAATDNRILLLENPENLGFVGTVNRGMEFSSDHDVVLLNSDAEVANDWLDRLIATAYSDQHVGTVTPFSNNATICSYPRFCEAHPLPAGHTTASLDALCAQLHPGAAVDIPTGVGFCMYIRRDCLKAVGLFDTANFGKGYGEENDFCHRAHKAGWRNLHALDTFVLHAGGISFGASKSARELAAMETLRRLHPDYETEVMRFIQADPAQPYRHAMDLARLVQSPKTKVLAVTHDRGGGTLRHVHELAEAMAEQAHYLCLTPAPGNKLRLELLGASEGFQLEFSVQTEFDELVELLQAVGVRLVHFHHMLGHHPSIQTLPSRLGVPFDFTAHDHYSYCPQISLTDHHNRYCGEKGVDQCRQCLGRSPAPGAVDIVVWRENQSRFLQDARHVLAPSKDTAQRMARFLPGADVRFAAHTDMADLSSLPEARPLHAPHGGPLKIAVIGAMSAIKGADMLEQVALEAAKTNSPLDIHLLGFGYRHLKGRPKSNLTVYGAYEEADLPQLLEWLQPDLVWFPAQWPETYSYTLSASLRAGLPIVAPQLGAFSERLQGRTWSWLTPWDKTASEWLAFFTTIRSAHFETGTPPLPPSSVQPAHACATSTWNYREDYLPTEALERAVPALPDLAWLHRHRAGQMPAGLEGATTGVRRKALMAVVRLRSAPGLRQLARAIPLRWQTRVKTWLMH